MALITLSENPQKITVPANTDDHTINFDSMLAEGDQVGSLLIDNLSGTVKFNTEGTTSASSGTYVSGDKIILPANRGQVLHYSGNAGGETFNICVISQ